MILDDMIDTAGTLANAARALKDRGARRVLACATHAVLSGPAVERITDSPLEEVDRDRHDPASRGEAIGTAQVPACSRSRACSAKRSSASTTATR